MPQKKNLSEFREARHSCSPRSANAAADNAAALAQAQESLIELQVKNAFLEKSLDELDKVVQGLNKEVQLLRREVDQLWMQQASDAPGGQRPFRLEDEVPPHY